MALDTDLVAMEESIAWDPFRATVRAVNERDRARIAESHTYRANADGFSLFLDGQFGRAGLDLDDGRTARAALMSFSTLRVLATNLLAQEVVTAAAEQTVAELVAPLSVAVVRHVPQEAKA